MRCTVRGPVARRAWVALGGSVLVLGMSGRALAEPPRHEGAAVRRAPAPVERPSKPTEPIERRWYGWQTLAADAAVAGFAVLDQTQTDGNGVTLVALAYLAVTPIIHDVHHNSNEALASLGLRVALPGAGAMIGFFAGGCGLLGGGCTELDVGAAAGLVGVVLIDAVWLAWENVPSSAAEKSSAGVDAAADADAASDLRLVPVLGIDAGRAWVGVGGVL